MNQSAQPPEAQQPSPPPVPPPSKAPGGASRPGPKRNFASAVRAQSKRVGTAFLENFLPQPHYLRDETVEKILRMAEYRQVAPRVAGLWGAGVLAIGLMLTFVFWLMQDTTWRWVGVGFIGVGVISLLWAVNLWLTYQQWQFILTNKRIILITPDPGRRGFADAIYLKRNSIKVLDTNYSKNPLWGLFQITQSARDVMLSLGGYEFQETGAQVKGGLRFPDMSQADIRELEELIFG